MPEPTPPPRLIGRFQSILLRPQADTLHGQPRYSAVLLESLYTTVGMRVIVLCSCPVVV